MRVIEAGHQYELAALDGSEPESLTFVKRCRPAGCFPGNDSSHSGTTMQEVLRALIDRCKYVNEQIPHEQTQLVISDLRMAIFRLEARAAQRHGRTLKAEPHCIEHLTVCEKCGHIECGGTCVTKRESAK